MINLNESLATGNVDKLARLLSHYALSHQHPTNEAIHCVAVPAIMLSLLGLLYEIHPVVFGAFMLASMVYYARISLRVLFLMAVWSLALTVLLLVMGDARLILCLTVFMVAWVGQFVGHKIEGRKPSFFEDIQYLWVGPLFVADVLLTPRGWRWRNEI
ncbi:MAG: DUF962 domain-containing protein [Burkholderiaceae bacterium]|jgi:uncharacterized membrane protein YGL010W